MNTIVRPLYWSCGSIIARSFGWSTSRNKPLLSHLWNAAGTCCLSLHDHAPRRDRQGNCAPHNVGKPSAGPPDTGGYCGIDCRPRSGEGGAFRRDVTPPPAAATAPRLRRRPEGLSVVVVLVIWISRWTLIATARIDILRQGILRRRRREKNVVTRPAQARPVISQASCNAIDVRYVGSAKPKYIRGTGLSLLIRSLCGRSRPGRQQKCKRE